MFCLSVHRKFCHKPPNSPRHINVCLATFFHHLLANMFLFAHPPVAALFFLRLSFLGVSSLFCFFLFFLFPISSPSFYSVVYLELVSQNGFTFFSVQISHLSSAFSTSLLRRTCLRLSSHSIVSASLQPFSLLIQSVSAL